MIAAIAQIGSSLTTTGLLLVIWWLERAERLKVQALRDSEQSKQIEWLLEQTEQKK